MSGVKKGPNATDVVYGLPLGLNKSNINQIALYKLQTYANAVLVTYVGIA